MGGRPVGRRGNMKISDDIIKILSDCKIENSTIFLPQIQLDRKTYLNVNKCLESIGGKWNRKAKGHVFDEDPTDAFENMLLSGETTDFKKEFQFFETPPELARKMVEMAELKEGDQVLEPSAGQGAILDYIWKCRIENKIFFSFTAIELTEQNCKLLRIKKHHPIQMNFLKHNNGYDKIIMNPPFTKQQDIDHILHAYSLLNKNGILVSIVSEGPFFRSNKKSVNFREWLESINAEVIKNPEGTFKSSGTMVNSRLIKIQQPPAPPVTS
jgi:type I restriction-modification system DNA methylase subunit